MYHVRIDCPSKGLTRALIVNGDGDTVSHFTTALGVEYATMMALAMLECL